MTRDGTETQRLWLCRWGTQSALVWAQDETNAELRVRHQQFKRRAKLDEVTYGPVRVHTEVLVLREATEKDKEDWLEAGAKGLPA